MSLPGCTTINKKARARRAFFIDGGGGGIRTHEGLSPLPVFKTGAFNRSATPPDDLVQFYLTMAERDGLLRAFGACPAGCRCAPASSLRSVRPSLSGSNPSCFRFFPNAQHRVSGAFFNWRRGRDSNPRYGLTRTLTFQASPFDHSGTSPITCYYNFY